MPDLSAECNLSTLKRKGEHFFFLLLVATNMLLTFSLVARRLLPPLFLGREMFSYKGLENSPGSDKEGGKQRDKLFWPRNKVAAAVEQLVHPWLSLIITVRCKQVNEYVCYLIRWDTQSASKGSRGFKTKSPCLPFLVYPEWQLTGIQVKHTLIAAEFVWFNYRGTTWKNSCGDNSFFFLADDLSV